MKRNDLLYRAKSTLEEFKKRSLGKLTDAEGTTSAMDEVDYLQIYIHDFENWDGKTVPPSTFTPLTVNDAPVLSQIKLDRSAMDYEPWWKGKAELYFRVYDTEASDDDRWSIGYLSPDGDHKSYQCWKWKTRHYVQDKPWNTISLNTGWAYSSFADENRNFSLKLIEYDPLFYDLAENSMWWCLLWLSPIIFAPKEYFYWLFLTAYCSAKKNDEIVGCGDNFKTYISYAKAYPAREITWDVGNYRIKIIVE